MNLISFTEARKIIEELPRKPVKQTVALTAAAGFVLANDVVASLAIPPFTQSGLDGYAVRYVDVAQGKRLQVKTEISAGIGIPNQLSSGQAARIFTGAPIPDFADTIVMQENTVVIADQLEIKDNQLKFGTGVRPVGSEIDKGKTALSAGSLLNPGTIGFLAAIGQKDVQIIRPPRVAIIISGNELATPGEKLRFGQIYDANSYMLQAALSQTPVHQISLFYAQDTESAMTNALRDALAIADLVLITGGVSVGKYDFVPAACKNNDVQTLFHGIKQKPGKPLYYGHTAKKEVFGLPGNPASVLTCFYMYVLPAIGLACGQQLDLNRKELKLSSGYEKASGLTHFLKGYASDQLVSPLPAQESYRLSAFAQANCFIILPETETVFKARDLIEVYMLPFI